MFLTVETIMAASSCNYANFNQQITKFSLESVECRVCNDVFSLQGEKVPRLLHCGHTVCHQCLTRLPLQSYTLMCPFDRQPTSVGDSGVWALKKNFALLELLERLQYSVVTGLASSKWSDDIIQQQLEHKVPCDENEQHAAIVYCVTCGTHLCLECSEMTHSTRTLMKHNRVALSDKPKEIPKCNYHPMQLIEFACLEEDCQNSPLMCYICKDYGRHIKHKHTLVETEAENVRLTIMNACQQSRNFAEEVTESAQRLGCVIQQMEGGLQAFRDQEGVQRAVQVLGTIHLARTKVQQYFSELYERLKQQEVAALTVVDTHVRERLCMMKQQQEDMAVLLSQITTVCHQCEQTLQQDDTKVLLAKQDIKRLLETIHKQQQQFAELPDQLQLDPQIPITFTKDNRVHIGPKMEMRVVTLGLDESGKTNILFQLKQREFIQTIPTIGFNVETVEYKNLKFTIWDVGGQHKLRPLWKHYYLNTQALIFVVDSSNRERVNEAYNELTKLLQEKELKDASLLIFANKQDIQPCMSIEEITELFNLFKLCCSRSWHIQACEARTGSGLFDGLEWLSHQLVATNGSPE